MSGRFLYRGFGLLIESELRLPELEPVLSHQGAADVAIRMGAVARVRRQTTLDEELAINSVGAAFLIRNGCEITVNSNPGAKPEDVRVVLLGRVMAFLLRQRGWLPLHASGVLVGDVCVLFLGAAGAGKSTIAAAFHRRGHLVVTDDVGAVRITDGGDCLVQTAWPCVRLADDARPVLGPGEFSSELQAGKRRYELRAAGKRDPYPVKCAYILEYGGSIGVAPVPTLRAIPLLSRHSFVRHGYMVQDALAIHLRDCAFVASAIAVRQLSRPRSLEELPSLVRFVEEDLARSWAS